MSVILMGQAFRLDMPPPQKLVLLALCNWSNDDGSSVHPSIKAIAKHSSMSERNAQRIVHSLINDGWLSVVGNFSGGKPGTTRLYRINVEAIRTGDVGVRGDNLSGVTNDPETGDKCDTGRVTNPAKTGDTGVTLTVIDPSSRTVKRNRHDIATSTRFYEFWLSYPVKTAKPQCLRKWKASQLDALADGILADIAAKRVSDRRWLDGYIPNPHTYLNQERWNDPVQPVARGGPGEMSGMYSNHTTAHPGETHATSQPRESLVDRAARRLEEIGVLHQ